MVAVDSHEMKAFAYAADSQSEYLEELKVVGVPLNEAGKQREDCQANGEDVGKVGVVAVTDVRKRS